MSDDQAACFCIRSQARSQFRGQMGFVLGPGGSREKAVCQEKVTPAVVFSQGRQGIGVTGIAEGFPTEGETVSHGRNRMTGSGDMDGGAVQFEGLPCRYFRKGKAGCGNNEIIYRRRRIRRTVNRQCFLTGSQAIHQHRNIGCVIIMPVTDKQRRQGFRRRQRGKDPQDAAAQIQLEQVVSGFQKITGGGTAAFRERSVYP